MNILIYRNIIIISVNEFSKCPELTYGSGRVWTGKKKIQSFQDSRPTLILCMGCYGMRINKVGLSFLYFYTLSSEIANGSENHQKREKAI